MKKLILAIVAILAGGALYYFLFSKPIASITEVTGGRAVQAVPGSVTVYAEFEMELKSEGGGRVLESELDPGRKVKKGEVLLQIDSADLELEIERIESEYRAAKRRVEIGSSIKLDLQTARENLANYEALANSGNYALGELEKQRRAVKQVEQRVALEEVANAQTLEGYENTLKAKRRQLANMSVTAPFDGVISRIYARPGDLIGSGAPLALIISTSRTVEAKISEENFADVRIGQRASVRFLGYGAWLYDATVTKILPTADPLTQRYVVHLDVQIEPEKLVPGITGEVSIVVGERQAEAIVPRRAIFGTNVYVVENGRVRLRPVEIGYESVTAAEVVKGLKPGELVIVDQLDTFRDGDRVRTVQVPAK